MVRILKIHSVFVIVLLQIHTGEAFAQMEVSKWYFGVNCALDFAGGNPVVINPGKTMASAGTAVIADHTTGELLFYTDGRNFWNRQHQVMQNAHTMPSYCYAQMTQPAIILPSLVHDYLYHVFAVRPTFEEPPASPLYNCSNSPVIEDLDDEESGLALFYYLLDMRLDGGLGNVVEAVSNVVVQSNITEKVTAIPHSESPGYWVIVHGWKNSNFYAHRLHDDKITQTVITSIGSVHGAYGGEFFRDETEGEMKASPNGKMIAVAVFSEERPFDLFNFDPASGKLSNYINLGSISGQYGVSFSPDNSKLYVSSDSRTIDSRFLDILLQFEVTGHDEATIRASAKSLIVGNTKTNLPPSGIIEGWSTAEKGMALGLDGRLYITANDATQDIQQDDILVVIDEPNKSGFDAHIRFQEFQFGDGRTSTGLPNVMQTYYEGLQPPSVCHDEHATSLYPNPTEKNVTVFYAQGCVRSKTITVINTLGQVVLPRTERVVDGSEIDLSALASGVYFFIFESPGYPRVIKRVVKL